MMQIRIDLGSYEEKQTLLEYTKNQLLQAVDRFQGYIQKINVRVFDSNGPIRKGIDKVAKITILLSNGQSVRVEQKASQSSELIDRAADRIKRSLTRRVQSWKERNRARRSL